MAFHDMWGEDEGSEGPSPRSLLKWLALLFGGVVVGTVIFVMLLPGGLLHPTFQAPVQADPSNPPITATSSPTIQPTPCLTQTASPPQTVSDFVAALNRDDWQTGWSLLDPALQQSLYGRDFDAFVNDWTAHGAIGLGQITYSQPSPTEADLVARFELEHPPNAQYQYHLRLVYHPVQCLWLIEDFSLPLDSTPTGSTSPTPTPAPE